MSFILFLSVVKENTRRLRRRQTYGIATQTRKTHTRASARGVRVRERERERDATCNNVENVYLFLRYIHVCSHRLHTHILLQNKIIKIKKKKLEKKVTY